MNLVFVVQCGVGDRHTSDEYGLEHRIRGDAPRPADTDFDADQGRDLFLRRELIGDRPPGGLGGESQGRLFSQIVDFDYHAVGLVAELVPGRLGLCNIPHHARQVADPDRRRVRAKT